MLQIQPDKDIVVEFIRNEDFKLVMLKFVLYMSSITPFEIMKCSVSNRYFQKWGSNTKHNKKFLYLLLPLLDREM